MEAPEAEDTVSTMKHQNLKLDDLKKRSQRSRVEIEYQVLIK